MKVINNSSNEHTFLTLQYNRVFAIGKIYRTHDVVVLSRDNEYSSIKGWCCGKLENGVIEKSEHRKIKHWPIVGMAHGIQTNRQSIPLITSNNYD
jgi:hypothetical protein